MFGLVAPKLTQPPYHGPQIRLANKFYKEIGLRVPAEGEWDT